MKMMMRYNAYSNNWLSYNEANSWSTSWSLQPTHNWSLSGNYGWSMSWNSFKPQSQLETLFYGSVR